MEIPKKSLPEGEGAEVSELKEDILVKENQVLTRTKVFNAIGGTVDLGLDIGEFALKQGLNIAEFGLTATGYTIGTIARTTQKTVGAVMRGFGRGVKGHFEKRMAS
jgi:hypothetical protein